MPNNYFKFKQFEINQENAGMKVTTDACIMGAWVPIDGPVKMIMDIGSGTGLLSLMLAQRCSTAQIHAVEIDTKAAHLTRQNFEKSTWSSRLLSHHLDIQHLKTDLLFDLMVCNPPFFKNSLKGINKSKNLAVHDDALSMDIILNTADRYLSPIGRLAIMYPEHEMRIFEKLAAPNNYFPQKMLTVKDHLAAPVMRQIGVFGAKKGELDETELIIKNESGEYTTAFTALLKDFYLHL